jgi:hypothetical protein
MMEYRSEAAYNDRPSLRHAILGAIIVGKDV